MREKPRSKELAGLDAPEWVDPVRNVAYSTSTITHLLGGCRAPALRSAILVGMGLQFAFKVLDLDSKLIPVRIPLPFQELNYLHPLPLQALNVLVPLPLQVLNVGSDFFDVFFELLLHHVNVLCEYYHLLS
jgi:hypothetical protein